ncbi:MAG TPA: hypothetical protein PKO06_03040, partial [Candidatus Ozemobacteraceae bacterium]|nr:hypothetical protein [Candidatus Ozemobacteraceae bacterium]
MRLRPLELVLSLASPFYPLVVDCRSIRVTSGNLSPKRFFRHFSGSGVREPRRWPVPGCLIARIRIPFQEAVPFEIAAALPGARFPRELWPDPGTNPFTQLPFHMEPRNRNQGFRSTFRLHPPIVICRWGNLDRLPQEASGSRDRETPSLRGTIMPSKRSLVAAYRCDAGSSLSFTRFQASLTEAQPVRASFSEEVDVWSVLYRSLPRRQKPKFDKPRLIESGGRCLARFKSLTYPWRPAIEPLRGETCLLPLSPPESAPTLEDLVSQPFSIVPLFHETFSETMPHRVGWVSASHPSPRTFPGSIWVSPRLSWSLHAFSLTRGAPRRPRLDRLPQGSQSNVPAARLRFQFQSRRERPLFISASPTSAVHPASLLLLHDPALPIRRLAQSAPHFVPETQSLDPGSHTRPLAFPVPFRTQDRDFWCTLLELDAPVTRQHKLICPSLHIAGPRVPGRLKPTDLQMGPLRVRFCPIYRSASLATHEALPLDVSTTPARLPAATPVSREACVLLQRPERTSAWAPHPPQENNVRDRCVFALEAAPRQRAPLRLTHPGPRHPSLGINAFGLPDWIDLPPWQRPLPGDLALTADFRQPSGPDG